ncbi:MAG: sulfite exporter TauE/SafE family protein [Candidatus Melainabacteria bacterium]|nr:sulfite exporter TauE/SafE family protein [Candidatus Melainabacteria bacterium]
MESFFSSFEQSVSNFLQASHGLPLPVLILLAFGGGLAASLTPCVLPMIPLYLSYIGASQITSRAHAVKQSFLFCFGAAIIFSLMGLFASFASFVMIEFRGYVNCIIGIFILFMALSVLEVIKLPLPQFITNIPNGGPFIVGVAFALVSSPCASPILFAILALSSASGSLINGSMIMIAYSIGYTGIIFATSLFAGFAKQFDFFKRHSKIVSVVSSVILGILGVFYLYSGIRWFTG